LPVPLTGSRPAFTLSRLSNAELSPGANPPDADPAAGGPPRRPAPSHWLVGGLIALLLSAALFANVWGAHERAASVPSLSSGEPGFALTTRADPAGKLTFGQVLADPGAFSVPSHRRINPAYVWYRVAIANDSGAVRRAIVALDNGYVLDATLYSAAGANPPVVEHTGASLRWAVRAVPGVKLAFTVELAARRESVFYVRVHDPVKQPVRFFLWYDFSAFHRLTDVYQVEYACYFALWFGLFIYNAFLYAVLRRKDYLYYLLYIGLIAAFLVTASGASTLVMGWPLWPLRGMLGTVLLNLTTCMLVGFSRVFLDTPARLPRLDPWLKRCGWVLIATAFGVPAWLFPAAGVVYEPVILLANILALGFLPVCGAILYFRRTPQAGIYVLAFFPLAAALVYALQGNLGRIPDARANIMPALTASALELILLALALAWRYRLITDEADRLAVEYASRLELEVAEQTRELREMNDSLASAIRDKERVLSILGHDLRGPAQMLSGLSRELAVAPDSMPAAERAELAIEIEEACQAQLELLDNLLLWGRTQAGAAPMAAAPASAAEIVQAATGALAQAARRKGLRLVASVEFGLVVLADAQAAETILRNLIGNAIKFTAASGSITVRGAKIGNRAEISVSDTGIGIAPERFNGLLAQPVSSQDGTGAEKGTGVGLTLCRDLARGSGGDLKIVSELRKGTTAILTLPAGA
jgi:signal transduction histidine kinase